METTKKPTKIYYCQNCGKWCGTNKKCPNCDEKAILKELSFARGNYYFIPGVGKPLDRVTNIINDVLAKFALRFWAAQEAAKAALADPSLSVNQAATAMYKKRDTAGMTGSDVHKIINNIAKGGEVDEEAVAKVPQVLAYRKFCKSMPHKILASEKVVYSLEHEFAGTTDYLIQSYSTAFVSKDQISKMKKLGFKSEKDDKKPYVKMYKPEKIWLMDFKTSKGMYLFELSLQLSAYKHALMELDSKLQIDSLAGIHLRPNGTFALVEVPDIFDIFLALKMIYDYKNYGVQNSQNCLAAVRTENKKVLKQLDYAKKIIGSYQSDCKNLPKYLGESNDPKGFCQGKIYKEALADISKIKI